MARQLTSIPDITPADAEYPAGRIRNDSPPDDGTPVIEELYGDIIQFFHKLMRLAGLTYSDVAENETTGFQFIEALAAYVRTVQSSITQKGTVELATDAETQAGVDTQRAVTPAGLESKTANQTRKGIAEIATDAEVLTGTDALRFVTPRGLAQKDGGLISKLINIGNWDMTSSANLNVAHSLTYSKIRDVQVFINDDAYSFTKNLLSGDGTAYSGTVSWDATNIFMIRGSNFNNSTFNAVGINRGYIIIKYLS